MLSGMLVLLLFGSTLGGVFGGIISQNISVANLNEVYYDACYIIINQKLKLEPTKLLSGEKV